MLVRDLSGMIWNFQMRSSKKVHTPYCLLKMRGFKKESIKGNDTLW